MKIFGWILAACLLLAGAAIQAELPIGQYADTAIGWVYLSKPVGVIVIAESADMAKLTSAQVAYLADPKLRADMKAAGLLFAKVDPDVKDASGKTPEAFVKAIALAGGKIPRLVLVGSRGGVTDYLLPVDEAAFRKRVGIP
jgi:hypothetical protein